MSWLLIVFLGVSEPVATVVVQDLRNESVCQSLGRDIQAVSPNYVRSGTFVCIKVPK